MEENVAIVVGGYEVHGVGNEHHGERVGQEPHSWTHTKRDVNLQRTVHRDDCSQGGPNSIGSYDAGVRREGSSSQDVKKLGSVPKVKLLGIFTRIDRPSIGEVGADLNTIGESTHQSKCFTPLLEGARDGRQESGVQGGRTRIGCVSPHVPLRALPGKSLGWC